LFRRGKAQLRPIGQDYASNPAVGNRHASNTGFITVIVMPGGWQAACACRHHRLPL